MRCERRWGQRCGGWRRAAMEVRVIRVPHEDPNPSYQASYGVGVHGTSITVGGWRRSVLSIIVLGIDVDCDLLLA